MTRTRVLIAPDKFKGCLTAAEVADAICAGFPRDLFDVVTLPLADGGDGSAAAAIAAGAQPLELTVTGPIGDHVRTVVAINGDTAIIEIASICGLAVLGRKRAPLTSSSFGVGEAIRQVIETAQPRKIILAVGGSATTDGGAGMLAALGVPFTVGGMPVRPTGRTLGYLDRVETVAVPLLEGVELVAATDVRNPLLGPVGAAAVFAPQKGASPDEVNWLERGLQNLVASLPVENREYAVLEGSGSAGGIGYACLALGGRIVSGADFFLDLLDFDDHASHADIIITGEGSFDAQTEQGKLISAVTRRAGRPVIVVAGRSSVPRQDAARLGVSEVHTLAELTDENTADDPMLSASLLDHIGLSIATTHHSRLDAAGPRATPLGADSFTQIDCNLA